MPSMEQSYLRQFAVYWEASGTDGYGQPTTEEPVEIRVRWNDTRRQVLDPQGNSIALDAEVVTLQELVIGSIMWLGTLYGDDGWYGTGSTGADTGLHQVVTYDETPDLKGRAIRREAGLIRWKNTLPG